MGAVIELDEAPARAMSAPPPVQSLHPLVDGLRWHVRKGGRGPVLLLLHGTGSASGSWRGLLPLLAARYTVLAPDLPGHGRTADPGNAGLGLAGMSASLRRLCDQLGLEPWGVIGHSAGAALACRMCLDGRLQVRHLAALNGALLPPLGMPLELFSPLARLLAAVPLVPRLLARRARDPAAVARLIGGTGSHLDSDGLAFYGGLMRDPQHVSAALRMMAMWDLAGLARELPRLRTPLEMLVADGDRTIPPLEARRVQGVVRDSRIFELPGLGHLAHEEDPKAVLAVLEQALARTADRSQDDPAKGSRRGELP